MIYYLFQDARGQWRRPLAGIGEARLIACYRRVRKIRVRGRNRGPIAWWEDGQQLYPLVCPCCGESACGCRARHDLVRKIRAERRRP